MIKYIDRLLIQGYFKAYFICLTSLLSLYIVVDLFSNLDEFTNQHHGLWAVVKHIGSFYGFKIADIFDRLSEVIVLLAGMFTIAWMQRSNELVPLLSAGVSTRRVVLPVLVSACLMLSLTVGNQEWIIPRIADRLGNDRDDPDGNKDIDVQGSFFDSNNVQIDTLKASRKDLLVRPFNCTIPGTVAPSLLHITAKEARYIPPGSPGRRSGGWMLFGTEPIPQMDHWDKLARIDKEPLLEKIDPGKYFLRTREIDFDMLTRKSKWYQLASTSRLYRELQRPDSSRLAPVAVLFHKRLTRPILGMILVFMGLSVILRDQNRNVFISAGMCLVICALFYGAGFASQHLGDNDFLSPALAAWLPVLIFGPLAFVMFDAVHT